MFRIVPLVAVVGVGSVALLAHQGAQQPPASTRRPGVTSPNVKISVSRLQPIAVFDIPGAPDWMAVDQEVWVSNSPKNSVTRIDPDTNRLVDNITVGARPCSGLAAGFGSLWVPNCGDKTVSRVDLRTGQVTATWATTIGNSEGGVAIGAGSFWMMTDAHGTLARIDPATNAVTTVVHIAPGSYAVAFGNDAVWITSTEQNLLTRVNARTNAVEATIPIGPKPRFLAVGEGSVWTLNQGDGTISRIDLKTNTLVATIEAGIPGDGGEIAVGEGSVWATVLEFPLTRIDPATNKVAQQFFGPGGDSVRVGTGLCGSPICEGAGCCVSIPSASRRR